MRILLGYLAHPYFFDIAAWNEGWLRRLRDSGIDVEGFCLTIDPPAPRFSWDELEARWLARDPQLLDLYARLTERLQDFDVFINYNGVNLHPEFVLNLDVFTVYGCFDDPESSDDLSRPVAAAYDLSMVGNISMLEEYASWGAREVRWFPSGFRATDFNPHLTMGQILNQERDIPLTLLCDRSALHRTQRLDDFAAEFPEGHFYGQGWPRGFLPREREVPLYQRTRVGVNMHHSTGPINFRTFTLPANGILQICDNKHWLGHIFQLDKEVVGFNSVSEAIALTRYYLNEDEERRAIAAAGWKRATTEYTEVAVFNRMLSHIRAVRTRTPVLGNLRSHPVTAIARTESPLDKTPQRPRGVRARLTSLFKA